MEMKEGAFALIDCLGFKGIWKRSDPAVLVHKLQQIEQTVHERVVSGVPAFEQLSYGPVRVRVRLLSDTVAISLQYQEQGSESPEPPQQNILLGLVCDSVIKVLDLFIKGEPSLVLRGCVTYGAHLSEGNFIVGPAVDDAAEHLNLANGAFVWFHLSAAERYRQFVKRTKLFVTPDIFLLALERFKDPEGKFSWLKRAIKEYGEQVVMQEFLPVMSSIFSSPIVIDPYNLPLKNGGHLECPVVNPLALKTSEEERQATIELYSTVMSGRTLDIWLKRQHTMEFLKEAERVSAEFYKKLLIAGENVTTKQSRSQQAESQLGSTETP